MFWDVLLAIGIGVTQVILTWYGVHVSVQEHRIRNAVIIGLVGFIGIGLTAGVTVRNSVVQDRLQTQLNRIQRNTEQPPTVQVNVPPPTILSPPSTKSFASQASFQEPEDSLRKRTARLADEWTAWVSKKLLDKDKPPDAFPNSSNPHPSEEEQKAIQKSQEFYRGIELYYATHFRERFVGMIVEYRNVGVDTHHLESTFEQFVPYPPMQGSAWQGNDPLSLFRELAYHVDAKGHLIVL